MNSYSSNENEKLNQIKSINKFMNLKNDYFLQAIFGLLLKKKSLVIIKYNKKLQNRININTINYKEFSQIYSSIEIEIKPIIPITNGKLRFIKIKENYHIYFDDNTEEIKRNYLNEKEKVSKIKIILDYHIKLFSQLFAGCNCIESINFKKFYRNNITDMNSMFYGCSNLKELNLNNFNTDNVTNISLMFVRCSSLEKLNLNNFNTANVTDMSDMFYGCSNLKELNLNNFNTEKVTNMSRMFVRCSSLKELNLSNFITNNVINMSSMFARCSSLKELNLSNFNTNNVINMSKMFYGCSSLKKLNLNGFNSNNVTDMREMFHECADELKTKIREQYKNINEIAF